MTGLIIFFLFIILTLPFLLLPIIVVGYIYVKPKTKILFCALVSLLFGIAGYWFIHPATDPDLVRYLEMLNRYSEKNLVESFNLVYTNLYAVDIYFYFISKLGNEQLLPAISVFIFYFIVLYILTDYKIRIGANRKEFLVYTIFMLTSINFCTIVNGIRWPLAFIIFFLAFYREIIQEKRNLITYFLYITSLLFHFFTIVFLLLRLILFIKNKKVIISIGAFASVTPQIINVLALSLSGVTSSFFIINQIIYSITRANMYFQWKEGGWADTVRNSGYYQLEGGFYYLVVILFILIMIKIYKQRNQCPVTKKQKWLMEEIFAFYLLITTLISFTMSAHTYIRFVIPLIVWFSLIVFKMQHEIKSITFKRVINVNLLLLSVVGIFLNIYLLRSMIDLGSYFANILSTGLITSILETITK